jgi:hypothetical protein
MDITQEDQAAERRFDLARIARFKGQPALDHVDFTGRLHRVGEFNCMWLGRRLRTRQVDFDNPLQTSVLKRWKR